VDSEVYSELADKTVISKVVGKIKDPEQKKKIDVIP
jgi:hypothetical protein